MAKRDFQYNNNKGKKQNIKVKKADSVSLDSVCDDGGGRRHRPQQMTTTHSCCANTVCLPCRGTGANAGADADADVADVAAEWISRFRSTNLT